MKRPSEEGFATDHQSAAPERSLTQRLDALERANVVRTKRAQLKRNLKDGRESIHQLLMDPPDYIETAKVFDMLLAVPMYGRVKVSKVLTQCRISPSKTIGGLSQRQRDELVSLLPRDREREPESRGADALEIEHALARLVEDARRVGLLAGFAALEAGACGSPAGRKPDFAGLHAALTGTVTGTPMATLRAPPATLTVVARGNALVEIAPPDNELLVALQRANEVRLAGAELKRNVAEGTLTTAEVVLTCPWGAASMTVAELLLSQRRWGATRCSKFLSGIGMTETKTIGSLTERQRRTLAKML